MNLVKDLYTIQEVADLFEVTKPTVYDWMARRGLQWLRVGGRRRITRDAILAFVERKDEGILGGTKNEIRTPSFVAAFTTTRLGA